MERMIFEEVEEMILDRREISHEASTNENALFEMFGHPMAHHLERKFINFRV